MVYGDVVKFLDVNILTGFDVVVTDMQDKFEATGFLNIPAGATLQIF